MSEGVEININKIEAGSKLVVSGLSDEQLNLLVPQINKEVMISITEDNSSLKAAFMRFQSASISNRPIGVGPSKADLTI